MRRLAYATLPVLAAIMVATMPSSRIVARSIPQQPLGVNALIDSEDRELTNLTVGDVVADVDRTTHRVLSITPNASPLAVTLILDTSTMTVRESFPNFYPDQRSRLANVIDRHFVAKLGPRDTLQIRVVGDPNPRTVPHADRKATTAMVQRAYEGRGDVPSPIWDAVLASLDGTSPSTGARAIVLCTAGRATGNRTTLSAVLEHAVGRGIPVHVVSSAVDLLIPQGGGEVTGPLHSRPSDNLKAIANLTGGLFKSAPDSDREYRPHLMWEDFATYDKSKTSSYRPTWDPDPGKALEEVARRMHGAWLVSIDAGGLAKGLHTFSIRSTRRGVTIIAPTRIAVE